MGHPFAHPLRTLLLVLLVLGGIFLPVTPSAYAADSAIPEPPETGNILDEADVLTPEEEKSLNDKIDSYESSTDGIQVKVYLFARATPSINGYSQKVYEVWAASEKSPQEVIILAEVSKGLAEIKFGPNVPLTNNESADILISNFFPQIKEKKKYSAGLENTVDAVHQTIAKNKASQVEQHRIAREYNQKVRSAYWVGGFLVIYLAVTGFFALRRRQRSFRYADAQIYDALQKRPGLHVDDTTRKDYRRYRLRHQQIPGGGKEIYNVRLKAKAKENRKVYTFYAEDFLEWLPLYRAHPELYRGKTYTPEGRF